MAFDVLNVPPMAAECERSFSAAGNMVTIRRTRLSTDIISAAQTVRSWLMAGLMRDYDGIILRDSEIVAMGGGLGNEKPGGDEAVDLCHGTRWLPATTLATATISHRTPGNPAAHLYIRPALAPFR